MITITAEAMMIANKIFTNVLYFASIEAVNVIDGVEVAHVVPVITYNCETDNAKLLLEKAKNFLEKYNHKVEN